MFIVYPLAEALWCDCPYNEPTEWALWCDCPYHESTMWALWCDCIYTLSRRNGPTGVTVPTLRNAAGPLV